MDEPLFSVIMPSFKRADLLKLGLSSWVNQKISYPYEILVLNDGVPDETEQVCESFYDKLPIKYIFIGQRNLKEIVWRCAGMALNIGVKLAKGNILILTCPEMYMIQNNIVDSLVTPLISASKLMTKTVGLDDRTGAFLRHLISGGEYFTFKEHDKMRKLCTDYPFLMGISKEEFISIGGYDEDFIGYAWDDTDFVGRMKVNGCNYYELTDLVIHLYHFRSRLGIPNKDKAWNYNEKLYRERHGKVIRNVSREWGILDVVS